MPLKGPSLAEPGYPTAPGPLPLELYPGFDSLGAGSKQEADSLATQKPGQELGAPCLGAYTGGWGAGEAGPAEEGKGMPPAAAPAAGWLGEGEG